MPKLSVKAVQLSQHKEQNDFATISIRVTFLGQSRYKETDYRVPVKDWDAEKQLIKKTYHNHALANATISKEKATIEKDLLNLKDSDNLTIQKIEKYLRGGAAKGYKSFSGFVLEYCKSQEAKEKKEPGTVRNYRKHLNKLHEFAGTETISFSDIDEDFLSDYEQWLKTEKKNSPNTVWDSLTKFIVKFFNESKTPLPDYDFPTPKETSKEYLTLKELDAIEKILDELDGTQHTDALYFLLECYSGIRHSDWTRFSVENLVHGDSFKVRAKKNKEPIYLSLKNRPRLRAILQRVKSHPYKATMENTNINLKIIAAKAGIKKRVSTHVGRHTCAVLHAELGYSVEFVAELLGISLRTAQIYYKVTRRKLQNEEERIGKGL